MSLIRKLANIFASGSEGHFAVFGKHPGWNDHIDDIGLNTRRLTELKRVLYVQGIRGNIDSGRWKALEPAERNEKFHHLFISYVPNDIVIGRFWSSTDGKGRSSYPMVVAGECTSFPLDWCLNTISPMLESFEKGSIITDSAGTIQRLAEAKQAELLSAIANADFRQMLTNPTPQQWLSLIANQPYMKENPDRLLRILYQFVRALKPYTHDRFDAAQKSGLHRSQHLRMPAFDTPEESGRTWIRFLLNYLHPNTPIFAIIPVDLSWVDLLIGPVDQNGLFCISASLERLPLTSEIPYNLDEAFVAQATNEINEARTVTGN